uniref:Uncharacterized protein n=1 Tax=Brugia timori TaxID=42155 RepID=A0A0R3R9A1_9BILA
LRRQLIFIRRHLSFIFPVHKLLLLKMKRMNKHS